MLNSAALRGDSTQERSIRGLVPDPSSTVQISKESWVQFRDLQRDVAQQSSTGGKFTRGSVLEAGSKCLLPIKKSEEVQKEIRTKQQGDSTNLPKAEVGYKNRMEGNNNESSIIYVKT